MPIDLEDIYKNAGNAAGEQEPPEDPKDVFATMRSNRNPNMSRAGASFKVQGVTPSDQSKFFGETGIADPALTGQDIALEAGNRQSFGNKLGRRLLNLVPNVTANILDIAGSMTSLLTEWGDERDYRNGLNELADSMKNPAGENYKRSNDTWAIGDPTWWIDNAFNTIEYAAAYGVGGVGIAKSLAGLSKAASTTFNLGARGTQWLNKAAQLGTSGMVSYAQGAQDGATVFKEVYENQFQKAIAAGQSPEEAQASAKHIAAQSAATTAQLSTLLTMGINSGAYAPMFRSQEKLSRDIIASRLMGLERTSFGEIGKVLRGMNATDYADKLMHHQGIKGILDEMVREGGEEVLQQFAQKTGSDIGNKGQIKDFIEQFGELENLVNRTANSEGLLAFTLGAAFGGLQHGVIHNIVPSRRVERLASDGTPIQRMITEDEGMVDKQGNPVYEKRWVTPRTYEKDFTQKAFNTVRDAVAHDFKRAEDLKDEFLTARKEGKTLEADEIRDEMFNTGKLYAIKAGMTEPWKKTFENIANMDAATAVEAGYAMDENDDTYKTKAQEAIGDLDHLDGVYKALNKKYDVDNNPSIVPLINMVFARQTDLYSSKKRIAEYKQNLESIEKEEQELANIIDPGVYNQLVKQYDDKHKSATVVSKQLADDARVLESGDRKAIDKILKKYRAIGFGTDNQVEAVKDLIGKLTRKKEELEAGIATAETMLLNSTDYNSWLEKHPGKSFDEYLTEVNKRSSLNARTRFGRAQLEQAETEYSIAQQNLADMTDEKNVNRFSKKAEQWKKGLEKEAEEIEKIRTAKLAEMVKDKATSNRQDRIILNRIAEKHRADRDAVYARIAENNEKITKLKEELTALRNDPIRALAIKRQIKNLTRENAQLSKRAAVLDSLFREYQTDEAPSLETEDAEDVTGEANGKTVVDTKEAPTTKTDKEKILATADEVKVDTSSPDAFVADILGSGIQADVTEFATIQDELEATKQASVIEEQDAFDTYSDLYNAAHPSVKARMTAIVNGMFAGTQGFSLDALNNFKHITRPEAHKLLIAARDYVEAVQNMIALEETIVPVSDERIADIEKRRQEELSKQESRYKNDLVKDAKDRAAAKAKGHSVESGYYANSKEGIDNNNEGVKKIINAKYDAELAALTPTTKIIVAPVGSPDTPFLESEVSVTGTAPESEAYHAGFKIIDAALTGATSTIGYEEGTKIGPKGEKVYVKVTKPTELNPELNEDILRADKLPGGHPLRYEVDINYEGEKMITDNLSWDDKGNVKKETEKGTDYLDKSGKVDTNKIDNVPIRVLDGITGEYLFHIRKMDWVNAQFPGTKDYRNVVDTIMEGDNLVDNIRRQQDFLMQLRRAIVERFNTDGQATEGKISYPGKGTGRLILNHVIEAKDATDLNIKSKVVPMLAYNRKEPNLSMLPEENELVISGDGAALYSGKEYQTKKPLGFDPEEIGIGWVGTLVKSANGQYMYAPLVGMKLVEPGKKSPALTSVTRAIELYILNDGTSPTIGAEIQELEKNTNFNVGTAQGLKSFINQYYTYTQGFQDSSLINETGVEDFVFDIDVKASGIADKVKQIKVGFTNRGDGVKYANLVNGKLSGEFVDALTEGFAGRARAVVYTDTSLGVKGINSSGMFSDAHYTGTKWVHNTYDNYNQYVKSFSRTPVYGRNQLPDGTYVYTANPQLPITMPGLEATITAVTPSTSVKEVPRIETVQEDLDAKLFDDLANFSYTNSAKSKSLGSAPDKSVPLTLEALEEKYNFTPIEQRNGKTVREVMENLTGMGHTYLSDGYNPFSRCL